MGPTCPECDGELIMDVHNLWLLPKIWTDYICPSCGKRYSATEIVKAIRLKQQRHA